MCVCRLPDPATASDSSDHILVRFGAAANLASAARSVEEKPPSRKKRKGKKEERKKKKKENKKRESEREREKEEKGNTQQEGERRSSRDGRKEMGHAVHHRPAPSSGRKSKTGATPAREGRDDHSAQQAGPAPSIHPSIHPSIPLFFLSRRSRCACMHAHIHTHRDV